MDDDYAMRIRMTFTFSVEDVPVHLRQKDHHTEGRSAAKQGALSIISIALLPAEGHISCPYAPEQHNCMTITLWRMCPHT